MIKSDVLALVGVSLLALFGYAIWPPLVLAVYGVASLRAAYISAPLAPDQDKAGDDA